ncbi:MAG TPA: hypothetical protein VLS53_03820 [Candidatus Dormibacteraeota bacterium]|nr:hypothetical protein [Candidatus Dormibacteraeota bacterium]
MDKDSKVEHDKPWRPADYPAPGPSWAVEDVQLDRPHRGVPDAED